MMEEKGETGNCSKKPRARLHIIFDQLNVNPERSCAKLEENGVHIKTKTKETAMPSAVENRKSPSKCATKHRSKPYSKDNLPFSDQSLLPAMNVLSFKTEKCLNKHCQCNAQPASSDTGLKPCDSLNFAKACRDSLVVLRQPRLKLHHAQKDHRVVLRAARLKLAAKSPLHELHKPLSNSGPAMKPSTISRSTVFGLAAQGSQTVNKDFSSLAKEAKAEQRESSIKSNLKSSAYRDCHHKRRATSPCVVKDGVERKRQLCDCDRKKSSSGLDLRQLSLVLPHCSEESKSAVACTVEPEICPRPHSCSVQASRVDDCTMDELACYFDDLVYIPKKMSAMAEMMYT